MIIRATIHYKMKETHPDRDCVVGGWKEGKEYTFTDIYTIDPEKFCSNKKIAEYIIHDLKLIAGGGYSTEHIYDICFDAEEVA